LWYVSCFNLEKCIKIFDVLRFHGLRPQFAYFFPALYFTSYIYDMQIQQRKQDKIVGQTNKFISDINSCERSYKTSTKLEQKFLKYKVLLRMVNNIQLKGIEMY
jgi:hypothetical protein